MRERLLKTLKDENLALFALLRGKLRAERVSGLKEILENAAKWGDGPADERVVECLWKYVRSAIEDHVDDIWPGLETDERQRCLTEAQANAAYSLWCQSPKSVRGYGNLPGFVDYKRELMMQVFAGWLSAEGPMIREYWKHVIAMAARPDPGCGTPAMGTAIRNSVERFDLAQIGRVREVLLELLSQAKDDPAFGGTFAPVIDVLWSTLMRSMGPGARESILCVMDVPDSPRRLTVV